MELRRYHNFMKMVAVARDKVERPQALHLDEGFLVSPRKSPRLFWAHLAALRARQHPKRGLRNVCPRLR
jgi:hypothetical protein